MIYNWFTTLWSFLLYSKVIQLCQYTYIFFIFFSITVYHRILNIAPCAIQQDLVVYSSCILWIYIFASANPKLPIHPSSTTPLPHRGGNWILKEFVVFMRLHHLKEQSWNWIPSSQIPVLPAFSAALYKDLSCKVI